MKQQVQSNTTAYKGTEVFSMGANFRKPTSQLKKIEIVFQKNTDEKDTDSYALWQQAWVRNVQGTWILSWQITSRKQSNDRLPQNTNATWNLLLLKKKLKKERKIVVHTKKKERKQLFCKM